jgi:hypothetical protein
MPFAPLNSFPSITNPPPIPVPIMKNITGLRFFALPNLYSAHIAEFASFSATTGKLKDFFNSSTKLILLKFAIFGAPTIVPRSAEISAATLMPIPAISYCD